MEQSRISTIFEESASSISAMTDMAGAVSEVCKTIVEALKDGRKILTAGNGGSAAEALHMAEELVGRYKADRCSLPGISLAADSTAITCIGNDYGYDSVFSRQIEGLGREGDILVLFTTSGTGMNLKLALEEGRKQGMTLVAFLGKGGGPIAGLADHEVLVPSSSTERIQEVHQVLVHIILEAVEDAFAG